MPIKTPLWTRKRPLLTGGGTSELCQFCCKSRLTHDLERDSVALTRIAVSSELARVLLILANFGKEGRPEPIIAKVSQETLAEMIGTTRSRVSYFMNKFRKLGFIDYNGTMEVHSSLLSVVLHDQPQIKT